MIREAELDAILTAWFDREGQETLPVAALDAALEEVRSTRQQARPRRIDPGRLLPSTEMTRPRAWLAVAVLVMLAAVAAIGVGARLLDRPAVTPRPSPTLGPSGPPGSALPIDTTPLALVPTEDHGFTIEMPSSWRQLDASCCEYLVQGGDDPAGTIAVSHDSLSTAWVCRPDCTPIGLPQFVPFSPARTIDAAAAEITALTGADDWQALPEDAIADLVEARRLTVTSPSTIETFVIGVHGTRLLAISASLDADAPPALIERVIASLAFTDDGQNYSAGRLIPHADEVLGYSIPIADFWIGPRQPEIAGEVAMNVRVFGEQALIVSVGQPDGSIVVCDPTCRRLAAPDSVGQLAELLRAAPGAPALRPIRLAGQPAWLVESADDPELGLVHAVTMARDVPVIVTIDLRDGRIDGEGRDAILAGFEILRAAETSDRPVGFEDPDGAFDLDLAAGWVTEPGPDPTALYARGPGELLLARSGDDLGRIVTCDEAVGPFETCREITATTLEALVAQVRPTPIGDHGVGPPLVTQDAITIDGQPAVLFRIEDYEYPAAGGEEIAYALIVRDGRPYIVRIYSSERIGDLLVILAGFQFTEPGPS